MLRRRRIRFFTGNGLRGAFISLLGCRACCNCFDFVGESKLPARKCSFAFSSCAMPVDDDGLCGQTKKETSPALLGYHGKSSVFNAAVSEAEQKKDNAPVYRRASQGKSRRDEWLAKTV